MRKKGKKLLVEIEKIKSAERADNTDLTPLERGFYSWVSEEIADMRLKTYELSDAKKIKEAMKLSMEIEKIEKALHLIIQLRLRKILMFAVWEKREIKNMTPEELRLYNEIRDAITRFENQIMGREEPVAEEHKEREKVELELTPPEENAPEEESSIPTDFSVLVRVKDHVGRFALPGNITMHLRKEDVLYIPEVVYRILLKSDKVEELRISE